MFQKILFSVQNRQWCFWGTDVKSPQQLLTIACAKPHNQPLLPHVPIQITSPHGRHRSSTPQTKHTRHAAKQLNKASVVTILHFHHKLCWPIKSGKRSEMSSSHSARHYKPRLFSAQYQNFNVVAKVKKKTEKFKKLTFCKNVQSKKNSENLGGAKQWQLWRYKNKKCKREIFNTKQGNERGGGGGVLKKTNGDFANHQNQKLNITYEHKKADNEISHNQKVLYSLLEK